ncbi:MAG: hypothetical protein ABIK44_04655 [candidate division WOR-3 bacterium]
MTSNQEPLTRGRPRRCRAVGMLSGGLDSILATKLMLEQGIEVFGLNFVSPFCTCTSKGCRHEATRAARQLGIPLKVVPTGQEYIEMVKHPKHGYGRNMNPCLDCRVFTFSRARIYMEEIGAQFVFSGEVLGERPMSQHLQALRLIERESGLEGRLLRPLSAKLLEPTIPEKEGLVDRERLMGFQGRTRKPQIALAARLGINDYPCPAGGCLLTERQFAIRLREAFAHGEDNLEDVRFLRYGRHFRLPSGAKVVVGRNELENRALGNIARREDVLLEAEGVGSPLTILLRSQGELDIELAARICARFSDAKTRPEVSVLIRSSLTAIGRRLVSPITEPELVPFRIG